MTPLEANALITWLNQGDRRITNTDATAEIWAGVLIDVPLEAGRAAIIEHYRLNGEKQPDPKGVRAIAYDLRNRAAAKQSALEQPQPKIKNPLSYRQRNPELWDQLFQKGQEARRTKLRRKGLLV